MTAIEFFNAALKHKKIFEETSDMVDIVLAADSMMDDYDYDIAAVSGTLRELYKKYTQNPESLKSLNQMVAASNKAFVELEKIMKEAVATAEGEHIDLERLEKEAKENNWSESEKQDAFAAETQMEWDWFIDNLAEEYWQDLLLAFKRDEKITWDHAYEVPRMLKRMEEELDKDNADFFTNDNIKDYINQNSDIQIDFDKDNVKLLIIQNEFEGYE